MAVLMGALRAALVDAGATEESATKAAAEVAVYHARLASADCRLTLLTWMAAATLALNATILFRVCL